MNKKGVILHPMTWIIAAFILGIVVAALIGRGIIPLGFIPVCP